MLAVIDYGVGNLYSLTGSLKRIGAESIVTSDADTILKADRIILPGVGAFGDAYKRLEQTGLIPVIKSDAAAGKPILGICLGMQLLFDRSYEYGEHIGLGLIRGSVCPIEDDLTDGRKVPHMGWNSLDIKKESKLFRYIENGEYVYYVHSYYAKDCGEAVTATSDYGIEITGAVENESVYGTQFHPEKSGSTGLNILKAFCEI